MVAASALWEKNTTRVTWSSKMKAHLYRQLLQIHLTLLDLHRGLRAEAREARGDQCGNMFPHLEPHLQDHEVEQHRRPGTRSLGQLTNFTNRTPGQLRLLRDTLRPC